MIIIRVILMTVISAQKIVEANTWLKIYNGTSGEQMSEMKLSGLLGYQTTETYELTTTLGKTYFNETSNLTLPVQMCYVE